MRCAAHRNGRPFTSDLSGQDFWTLLSAGYRPLGMVMGTCVYHVAPKRVGRVVQADQSLNVECAEFTQALYDARELAMERMQAEAEALEAEGIVGVQLQEGSHGWDSHVIEYFAIGTAVTPISDDHTIPPPSFVLTLNDPSQDKLSGPPQRPRALAMSGARHRHETVTEAAKSVKTASEAG